MPTDTTQSRSISAATDHMLALTATIADTDLDRPTPCRGTNLAALLAHVDGLSQAFAAAARKDLGPLTSTPPDPAQNQSHLPAEWRDDLRHHVHDLAKSWDDPDAWEGMFGPVVQVPDDAPLVDRLAGLTGRDPRWPQETPQG